MPKDLSAQQVGLQGRSSATQPRTSTFTGRTRFPMSYQFANTYRYGHVQPFYYQHTVGDDHIPLFADHDLSTYTLSSPLKADVRLNKTYFMIDYKALYPRNWDQIYMFKNKGDDVPEDSRLVTTSFLRSLSSLNSRLSDSSKTTPLERIKYIFLLESIFSTGSLFSQFNIHLQDFFIDNDNGYDFDTWFDLLVPDIFVPTTGGNIGFKVNFLALSQYPFVISEDGSTYFDGDRDLNFVSLRRMLELFRSEFPTNLATSVSSLNAINSFDIGIGSPEFDVSSMPYPLNLEIIAAYQLGCAQFFTDSSVDYVYDANTFLQALEGLQQGIIGFSTFSMNGVSKLYDVLSGYNFDAVMSALAIGATSNHINLGYQILQILFGHRQSLRFGDYFISCKVNSLAPGDVSVDTSGVSVSVVDITRKISLQRLYNKVNISLQKIGDYARQVMGLSNADDYDYSIPAYLGSKSLLVRGFEVENTGDGQRDANSVTTLLRSSGNIKAFDIDTKRPGIIIGVLHFDVPRIYSKTIDRMHMHMNRFDDFIPEMQFTGDQAIYLRELDHTHPKGSIFAYALRYMEYKIRNHYAAGGAINAVKSWFMITDNRDGNFPKRNIDPDYIRSQPSEFDRFYSSLTGYSLGNYFHFIVLNTNYQDITRDMVLAPEILK